MHEPVNGQMRPHFMPCSIVATSMIRVATAFCAVNSVDRGQSAIALDLMFHGRSIGESHAFGPVRPRPIAVSLNPCASTDKEPLCNRTRVAIKKSLRRSQNALGMEGHSFRSEFARHRPVIEAKRKSWHWS
jgi:hypothetical protein